MRIKRGDDGEASHPPRALEEGADQMLVPAMNSIEHPQGKEHGPSRRLESINPVVDFHTLIPPVFLHLRGQDLRTSEWASGSRAPEDLDGTQVSLLDHGEGK